MLRGLTVTAVALAATAACSSFGASSDDVTPPTSDAGVSDSAPNTGVDAASDAATSPSCPADAELCEDFESGNIDPNRWKQVEVNGTLAVVEASPGPNGVTLNQALRATATSTSTEADVVLQHFFDAAPPITVASRAFVRINAMLRADTYTLSFSAYAGGSANQAFLHSARADVGSGKWAIVTSVKQANYTDIGSTIPVAIGDWTCVELVATFATVSALGHLTLFVDDELAADAVATTYDSTLLPTEFAVQPGLIDNGTSAVRTVDTDNIVNVVISGAQTTSTPIIGCK